MGYLPKLSRPLILSEWYRHQTSPLERTLRLPKLTRELILVLFERILTLPLLISLICRVSVSLVSYRLSFALFFVLAIALKLVWEMIYAKDWWQKTILPRHLRNIEKISQASNQLLNQKSTPDRIIQALDKLVDLSVWGMARSIYIAFPSMLWEIIIKFLYPYISRTKNQAYSTLFIGFENKNIESDMKLWEVSQESSPKDKDAKLNQYLDLYGSRVMDIDLALPTLRERPQELAALVRLFSHLHQGPKERLELARAARQTAEQSIYSPFLSMVRLAQKNVCLREDRRFYEFSADYDIRQIVLLLGKKLGFMNPQDIFGQSWDQIKKLVKHD